MVCETGSTDSRTNGLQPGDRVCWRIYDATHYGTVIEAFNANCVLVDRGRTFLFFGIPLPDIDIVGVDHLMPCPAPPPSENGDAEAVPRRPLSKGRAKRRRRSMRKWRAASG